MRGILTGFLALIVLLLAAGGVYLLFADPKPEIRAVETAIPNDRLPN